MMRQGEWRGRFRTTVALVLGTACAVTLFGAALPGSVSATLPPLFWQSPGDGASGDAAGRLGNPQAIAADPTTGLIYVMEQKNSRVSEFDPWGQFVRAWGWGVLNGSPEPQTCIAATGCQAGISGAGEGQFDRALGGGGLAVGPEGSVYVGDPDNFRIEKFDNVGNFLLEFGEEGTGPGQFQFGQFGTNLAVAPDGTVYVGEKDRIQAFEPSGAFKEAIPFEGELEGLKGKTVESLAIDGDGNLYITSGEAANIFKASPTGSLVSPKTFSLTQPRDLAVDEEGNVYTTAAFQEVVKFDPSAGLLIGPGTGFGDVNLALAGLATSSACGVSGADLYVTASNGTTAGFITAYGQPPDPALCPPPAKPPTIAAQFATSAAPESAQVKAKINSHFWPDTSFYVEYGTGKCSEGGCSSRQPVSDQDLTDRVVDTNLPTHEITLPELQPGTKYHFRFVSESGGGGPVFGLDPDGEGPAGATALNGIEGNFTTPKIPSPLPNPDPCATAQFRTGPSAFLADCRAYEMVSPVNKGGGEIFTLLSSLNDKASLNQSSLDGSKMTFSSFRAFGDAKSAPATSQYLATRGTGGWTSQGISPPRGTPHHLALATVESQFRAFNGDLCSGWLIHDTDPPLAPGALEGFPNIYKAGLCGSEEAYEALTTVEPPGQTSSNYFLNVQGISADSTHVAFRAPGKLTASAASNTNYQCYESSNGVLRLVSVLPSGQPNPTQCSVGTTYSNVGMHTAQLQNAMSHDGSRIFWTASSGAVGGPGKIYLRVNGKNPTISVSAGGESLSGTTAESRYWTAAADGSRALYSTGNLGEGKADLFEFRAKDQSTHLITHKVLGLLGASDDALHIYLASEEVLSGANAEGKSPVADEPNLYLYDGPSESFRFIGILSSTDAKTKTNALVRVSPLATEVNQHTARVAPDGEVATFMSTAPLTGFDNTDAASGEADAEVYRYDAAGHGGVGQLDCISCNPSGVAPTGRELTQGPVELDVGAAASIPGWETQLHAARVLSDDGKRVFFNSFEPLVPRDSNAKQDVYEWEAPGTGSCSEESSAYSPPNGGCLSLISSGQSSQDSEIVDTSPAGRDVFFATASTLLVQDPGLIDIYDAREGGGFPAPAPPIPQCQGEACQGAPIAPAEVSPSSSTYQGPGNLKHRYGRCKGKKKAKKRCAKHLNHHKHRGGAR